MAIHKEQHASTHSDGGTDEVNAADLGSGAATNGQVLTADGTGGNSYATPSGGSGYDTFRFQINGKPNVSNDCDGAWIAPRAGTFTRITLYRRTAGTAGSTIVDVNKNGTTLYTTQANRPTVTQAGGNDQIDATTDYDVTTFAQDDRIEMDIDAVETGNLMDVSVIVEVEYS